MFRFLIWVLVLFPRHILRLAFRSIVLVNNEISFTLNLRLLFTPLFGDYTLVGRTIGFFVRITEVFIGGLLVIWFALFALLSPFIWYLVPMFLVYVHELLLVPYLLVIIGLYYKTYYQLPLEKITTVNPELPAASFRRHADVILAKIATTGTLPSAFFENSQLSYLLDRLELTNSDFAQRLVSESFSSSAIQKKAYETAVEANTRYVEIEHLLIAVLLELPKLDVFLSAYQVPFPLIKSTVFWITQHRDQEETSHFWQTDYVLPQMGGVGKGLTGRVTPALDSISEDLTKEALRGTYKNITAHKDQVVAIMDLLAGSNANVLLLGPPGCGKTSVVKAVAHKIVQGVAYENLKFKRLVSLNIGGLIAGSVSKGQLSSRLSEVFKDIKESKDIILFIDEIHNLVSGADSGDGSLIFSFFEPYLSSGDIQFIGATNLENYRKYIDSNGSFARLFEKVEITPTGSLETLDILLTLVPKYEAKYGVWVSVLALNELILLSDKLIHERVLPDKAIDILNRACTYAASHTKRVDVSTVRTVLSDLTHIPVANVGEDEAKKLLHLDAELKRMVIGQDVAVDQVTKALQRARVGIRDEGKPIASFLFVGTTGVGKTQTAKALAKTYFGDEKLMIRLDMSEYQQADSINRLLGDPTGSTRGILTEAVRSKPFSLILLDEIEKANANILLTFLQVLDDGRLTDNTGTVVDFTNTIIIATSNVGTRTIQDATAQGLAFDEISARALTEVRDKYAPEFLNRFTGIIVFRPLDRTSIERIVLLQLQKVAKVADAKGLTVSFAPGLTTEIINRGYNQEWGARPLSRLIEDNVESYLALRILAGEFKPGTEITLGPEVFSA